MLIINNLLNVRITNEILLLVRKLLEIFYKVSFENNNDGNDITDIAVGISTLQ